MIPLILGVIVGILTSYTDIKTSYIYEEHFFPSVAIMTKWWCSRKGCEYEAKGPYIPIVEIGILYNLITGIKHGNIVLALSPIIGLIIGLGIGYFLYYTGGWASGDVIILGAYSALLPYVPDSAKYKPPYSYYLPMNAFTILFNSLLLIFPLILVYSVVGLAVKGKIRELVGVFREGIRNVVEVTLWINFGAVLLAFVSLHMSIPKIISWILTFALILIFSRFKLVGDVLGVLSIGYGLYLSGAYYLKLLAKMFLVIYSFKLIWSAVKALRREVLIEERKVSELNPGDVLGERIILTSDGVVRDRADFFEKISSTLKGEKVESLEGEEIAGFSVEGLTQEQIEKLKALVSEGKLEDEFLVRKAMPFAPALFLGFLVSYFFGDILWWLVLKVAGLA